MCFSAGASFMAAAGLALISLASFRKVQQVRQLMFASIPALFAMQQFSEGLVWLSAQNIINPLWQQWVSSVFLTFAFVIWPTWIPLSLLAMEKHVHKRHLLKALALAGILWSAVLVWLLAHTDVITRIYDSSVCYTISSFDAFAQALGGKFLALTLYLIPVILPFFISSIAWMELFGIAGLVSCALTLLLWQTCFVSVWCYFAALLSSMLIFLFPRDE